MNARLLTAATASIMRMPIGGGQPMTLASGHTARDIAVDKTSVYWADLFGKSVMKLTPK